MQVTNAYERRIDNLKTQEVLDDYWSIAKQRDGALVATAVRIRSVSMRDILIHGSLRISINHDQLRQLLFSHALRVTDVRDFRALADLGTLILLQQILPGDAKFGEKLLTFVLSHLGDSPEALAPRRVLVQHLIQNRKYHSAENHLQQAPELEEESHGYLRGELSNPFTSPSSDSYDDWLSNLNKPLVSAGLQPVRISEGRGLPFDRLYADISEVQATTTEDPLVSVVMTAFEPDVNRLLASVKSILNQNWSKLELIIVDRGSGNQNEELFNTVRSLDPRIKLIFSSTSTNEATSRNIGCGAARGDFITFQRVQDWSHPQRIATQVALLRRNTAYAGCVTRGIWATGRLERCVLGSDPVGAVPSTVMLRRESYLSLGGFLEGLEEGFEEVADRARTISGRRIAVLKKPLLFVRNEATSNDGTSLQYSAVRHAALRSSYRFWHRNASTTALRFSYIHEAVEVPDPLVEPKKRTNQAGEFDVVFAGDWQRYGGPQKSMMEEIKALAALNLKIGVMNLEAGRFMQKGPHRPLNGQIQNLINEGTVTRVFYDDSLSINLLILRYPPILQFFTHDASSLIVNKLIILANQAPSELDGSDIRYRVQDCHANAQEAFGTVPLWVPQGPQVRDYLEMYLEGDELATYDMPGILDLRHWWHKRMGFRSKIPVVGRHSRDTAMKWPADPTIMSEIYKTHGEYDVRFMGGKKAPLQVLGTSKIPPGWTIYEKDELPVPRFLSMLDFFVFYQHPEAVEAFGRAILEAIASGVVVVLPKHFERVFGPAAVYAEPHEVASKINELHTDFSLYSEQLDRAKKSLNEYFSHESYRLKIQQILHKSQNES